MEPLIATLVRRAHLSVRRQLHSDLIAAGFHDISPVHLYVFQLPGPDGLRPTELAERINMTKQATNHLLGQLESLGYLRRMPADADGRAKTIRTTRRGREVMRILSASSKRLERRWARSIGADAVRNIREALIALDDVVAAQERPT